MCYKDGTKGVSELGQRIEVDEQVYEWLRSQAVPFEDTPNSVLRRIAGLGSSTVALAVVDDLVRPRARVERQRKQKRPSGGHSKPTRVRKGVLLPVSEYHDPLLAVLLEMGGSGPTSSVIAKVGDRIRLKLTPLDRARYGTGGVRWENRVQFSRLRLVEAGMIDKNSPKGIWQLTDLGRKKAASITRAS
jgi:hypothetical protein